MQQSLKEELEGRSRQTNLKRTLVEKSVLPLFVSNMQSFNLKLYFAFTGLKPVCEVKADLDPIVGVTHVDKSL